jgi:hypothetical protein
MNEIRMVVNANNYKNLLDSLLLHGHECQLVQSHVSVELPLKATPLPGLPGL